MKTKWLPILAGAMAGFVVGAWSFLQSPRPAICVFLQAPLVWLGSCIDSLRIFPRESLAGLIVVVPLWFIYWACLGAVTGLLLRWLFRLFWKRSHNESGTTPEAR
jgi:hypothetical protein